jgi:hypothetical protein
MSNLRGQRAFRLEFEIALEPHHGRSFRDFDFTQRAHVISSSVDRVSGINAELQGRFESGPR